MTLNSLALKVSQRFDCVRGNGVPYDTCRVSLEKMNNIKGFLDNN